MRGPNSVSVDLSGEFSYVSNSCEQHASQLKGDTK